MLALLLFLNLNYSHAETISSIHENNTAVKQLEKEKFREAEATLLQALTEDPFNPEIRYNLGTAYLAQKKFDRAVKEYQTLLRQPNLNPEIAFYANFNSGVALTELKKTDEALNAYQAALDAKPDSRETKVNIELLAQSASGQQKKGEGQGQGGEPDDKKDDGKSDKPKDDPKDSDQKDEKNKKPQNFSKDELKKVFEELERQEQKVRSLEYGSKHGQEKGPEKDW